MAGGKAAACSLLVVIWCLLSSLVLLGMLRSPLELSDLGAGWSWLWGCVLLRGNDFAHHHIPQLVEEAAVPCVGHGWGEQ